MPSRFSITFEERDLGEHAADRQPSRGPGLGRRHTIAAAAPALAAALTANRNGSSRRASCQTGIAVFADERRGVDRERRARRAPRRARPARCTRRQPAGALEQCRGRSRPARTPRIQVPTLIGEVDLEDAQHVQEALGPPEVGDQQRRADELRRGADLEAAPRELARCPRPRATRLSTDEAPASPPVKKYQGISGVQTGSLTTGRP